MWFFGISAHAEQASAGMHKSGVSGIFGHLDVQELRAKVSSKCGQEVLSERPPVDLTLWWDDRPSSKSDQNAKVSQNNSRIALWLVNRFKSVPEDLQQPGWGADREGTLESAVAAQGFVATHWGQLEVRKCRKFCEDGRISDAVDALDLLVQRGQHIHNNLFYRMLKWCISHKDLELGKRIHALTIQGGHEGDAFLATHLMGMYATHGMLEEAMQVFTTVFTPDAYNWATIIFAYARHGEAAEAIRLYQRMRESTSIEPDNRIYVAVLKACAGAEDLVAGKDVHAHIVAGPGKPDKFVQAGLVDMYAKCGSVQNAREVFDMLPEKTVVAWNAMLAGYAQQGMGQEAISFYQTMQEENLSSPSSVTFVCLLQACASVGKGALLQGKELHSEIQERGIQMDVVLGGSLVNMYAKCGSLEDARIVFDILPVKNVVTWTAMIAGYAQQGMCQEALCLYKDMQDEGLSPPDSVTYICLLQACAAVVALPLGKKLHAEIEERGIQDVVVGAALVNMYAKCGCMSDSQRIFDSLPVRSIGAWGALMSGYAHQGDSDAVFDLLDKMKDGGVRPDGISFISVLTVCSHLGLVDRGREFFEAMETQYGIRATVEHFTCMMDLLGRAGHLDDALKMAKTMPFPPTEAVWHTLLGACRKWKNVHIGRQAFQGALTVDENDAASYVLMSNIYASVKMWDAAKEMQARRKELGAWKGPGQSWWTDFGGVVHTFVAGEKKQSDESEGRYSRQAQVVCQSQNEGSMSRPHLSQAISDDEMEAELCGHTEKLAIAYALKKTPEGTTIRIVKNLCMCAKCHEATAHISKEEKRTIICRDSSRFHVFKEGKCSCGDY